MFRRTVQAAMPSAQSIDSPEHDRRRSSEAEVAMTEAWAAILELEQGAKTRLGEEKSAAREL